MRAYRIVSFSVVILLIAVFFAGMITVPVAAAMQAPIEQWNKTYGQGNIYSLGVLSCTGQQTTDGGYILAGYNVTGGYGLGLCAYLIKTDAGGNVSWSKWWAGSGLEDSYCFYAVQQTTDGGYILTGDMWKESTGSYTYGWLFKTYANGTEQWSTAIAGSGEYRFSAVHQTTDGGYILTGYTEQGNTIYNNGWLVKTDANGKEQWNSTIGGSYDDEFYAVQQTTDGGYILAGATASYSNYPTAEHADWLVKTDANGHEQWNNTFDQFASADTVQQTTNGGYVLGGTSSISYGPPTGELVKTDASGTYQWATPFGGYTVNAVQQTTDGGYVLTGPSWFAKTDAKGSLQWTEWPAGSGNSVQQTSDGGYIVVGLQSYRAWLVKFGPSLAQSALTATASPTSVIVNRSFWVSGALNTPNGALTTKAGAPIAGATVQLQKNVSGTWQDVAGKTATTGAAGAYRISTSEPAAGTYQYRVTYAGNAAYANATSGVVTVTVTNTPAGPSLAPKGVRALTSW